jgi:YegS/Rv2252/BmrU family lipid kinase
MQPDSQTTAAKPESPPKPAESGIREGRMRFIFNPCSGKRRNARLLPIVRSLIASRSLDADLVTTEGPGHATELAGEAVAGGCARVVAVGGDGTVNEVAQALVNSNTTLALVPCGSGNGLARHLGLPGLPEKALELAADPGASLASMDTGSVNGHPFFNAMGLGLDAEVSRRFNGIKRRGLPAYAKTALEVFFQRRTERCVITFDDRSQALEAMLIAVANSDQYGNGAFVAPGARVDDGLLDLVAVQPVGIFGAAALGFRLFSGSFDRSSRVHHIRGEQFIIGRPFAGTVHTDGEIHETGAILKISVHPHSLSIVVSSDFANSGRKRHPDAAALRILPFALNL